MRDIKVRKIIFHIFLSISILLSYSPHPLYANTEQTSFQNHSLPIGIKVENGLPYLLSQSENSLIPKLFFDLYKVPLNQIWVNLKPGLNSSQIFGKWVGITDAGKYLIEADILLKQVSSETLNELLEQTTFIPQENTQIRFWIEPDSIQLLETHNTAIIKSATLKVNFEIYPLNDIESQGLSNLIREYAIPKLTHMVNFAPEFSKLRQIYFTLILIRWLKQKHTNLTILELNNQLYHSLYPTQWSLREIVLKYAHLYFSEDLIGVGGIFLSKISDVTTKIKITDKNLSSHLRSIRSKISLIPWKQFLIGLNLLILTLTASIGPANATSTIANLIKRKHFNPEKTLTNSISTEQQLFNQKILSSLRSLENHTLGIQLKIDNNRRLHIIIKDFQQFLASLYHPFFYNYIYVMFFSDNIILETPYISPDSLYNLWLRPRILYDPLGQRLVRMIMLSKTFKSDLKDLIKKTSKGQRNAKISLAKAIALANALNMSDLFKEVLDEINIPLKLRKTIEELVRCQKFSIIFENLDSPYWDLIEASLFYILDINPNGLDDIIKTTSSLQDIKQKSQQESYRKNIENYLSHKGNPITLYGYLIRAMASNIKLWIERDLSKIRSSKENPYLQEDFIEFIKEHQNEISKNDLLICLDIIHNHLSSIIPGKIRFEILAKLSKKFNISLFYNSDITLPPLLPFPRQLQMIREGLSKIRHPSYDSIQITPRKLILPFPNSSSHPLYLEQNRAYTAKRLSDLILVYMILNNPPLIRNILLSYPNPKYKLRVKTPSEEMSTKQIDQQTIKKILTLFYTMPFPLVNFDDSEFAFEDYNISGKFLISIYLTKAFQEAFSEYDTEQQIQFLMATINQIMWSRYSRYKIDPLKKPITIDEIKRAVHTVKINWNYIKKLEISIPKKKNIKLVLLSFNPPKTFEQYDLSADILKRELLKIPNVKIKCHTNSMDTFLKKIRKTKGPLWIVVNTHGFFSVGNFFLSSDNGEKTINVDLMHTSLLEYAKRNNGNLSQVIIFACNCFSGCWEELMQKLIEDVNKGKISSLPLIITTSPVLSSAYAYSIYPIIKMLQKGQFPITIEKVLHHIKGRHPLWYSIITGKKGEKNELLTLIFLFIPPTGSTREEEEEKKKLKKNLNEILSLWSPEKTGGKNLIYEILTKYREILNTKQEDYDFFENIGIEQIEHILNILNRIPTSEEELNIQENEKTLLRVIGYCLSKKPELLKQFFKNTLENFTHSQKTKRGGISFQ